MEELKRNGKENIKVTFLRRYLYKETEEGEEFKIKGSPMGDDNRR